jgi:hypothetical protein
MAKTDNKLLIFTLAAATFAFTALTLFLWYYASNQLRIEATNRMLDRWGDVLDRLGSV